MYFSFAVALLQFSSLHGNYFVDAFDDSANVEIISNPLTASRKCSHEGREWRICVGDYYYLTPDWYCPSVLDFDTQQEELLGPCFVCPDDGSDCDTAVSDFLKLVNNSYAIPDGLLLSCQDWCEAGKTGDDCWPNSTNSCTPGSHFCDFASDDDFKMNISGTCKACPLDEDQCYHDGFATSSQGKRNCASCTLYCWEVEETLVTVNGAVMPNYPMRFAIQKAYQNVSGPLIDCSNLILDHEDVCPGAEGHVCIVDQSVLGESEVGKLPWKLSNVAEKNGCVAIISTIEPAEHQFDVLEIPFVLVDNDYLIESLRNEQNIVAQVELTVFGSQCIPNPFDCSIDRPCREGEYCQYFDVVVDDEFTVGLCEPCPTKDDTTGCFFPKTDEDFIWRLFTSAAVESCANTCNATLFSTGGKFSPSKLSILDLGVEDKDDQCIFCPNNDIEYPDNVFRLFGGNITCRRTQTLFNRIEFHKDDGNCVLAQSENYRCGCTGTGYAGANTHMKQVMLAWLPRVAAILSIAGSMFIIYDTLRTRKKRVKLRNQLLSTLSAFDILGSCAYALTTLPTPKSDMLYGAQGNELTCTTQAFFIQIGTIACLLNVSLAMYFLLMNKYQWTEDRLKSKHCRFFLFFPPIFIGLLFAFVGIPFYEEVKVWCNNSEKLWPEIPIIFAIIAATGIMGSMCRHFYKNEIRTVQYTRGGAKNSMKVFKQAFWFVIAFYITWVPYLTLQYMLSFGKGYVNYGLILSAVTLVPLQGFWNCFVYIRPRYLSKVVARVGSSIRPVFSFFQITITSDSNKPSVLEPAHHNGANDQLQVVQVDESNGEKLEDTRENKLKYESEKEDISRVKDSRQSGNGANDPK